MESANARNGKKNKKIIYKTKEKMQQNCSFISLVPNGVFIYFLTFYYKNYII